jgi:ubiquinone/menaquinone biosynthesis C-methylase UbiE
MSSSAAEKGLAWQIGVWDRMAEPYQHDVDVRFAPVVEAAVRRVVPQPGEQVLDLGTGTGAVAVRAAALVGVDGHVTGVDISREMLAVAAARARSLALRNVSFLEGRAEAIPVDPGSCDVLIASLSLMYVIDRAAAAREIARVLRPGGRFVAAVWAGPEHCDIVRFQQTAGRFAPEPPVADVGPGALAETAPFVAQLAGAGIRARVETETLGFDFDNFQSAWDALAAVTTAALPAERRDEARAAVKRLMWPTGDGPRFFRNLTQFIVGTLQPESGQ